MRVIFVKYGSVTTKQLHTSNNSQMDANTEKLCLEELSHMICDADAKVCRLHYFHFSPPFLLILNAINRRFELWQVYN